VKTDPYWWEAAPREATPSTPQPLPAGSDVVVVGSGYTGLSCALTLARAGRSVVVLDAETPGHGASSRSGGMVGHGHRLSFVKLKERFGDARALDLIREGIASLDYTTNLIAREKIDARFARTGRFRGAWSEADFTAIAREAETLSKEAGLPVEIVAKRDQHREIATDKYQGGILFPTHGGLHPALFHTGLLARVREAGVAVIGNTPVTGVRRDLETYMVETERGVIVARDVVIATNGYTGSATRPFARRIVGVPSFLIATERLGENRVKSLIPNGRMIVETRATHFYYRPSPDGTRIVFGGRAALHPIPLDDAARRLSKSLSELLPGLDDVRVDHAWTGNVAFTMSDLPAIGRQDGLWFALGCNGSGVALMPFLGHKLALKILGDPAGLTAYDDIPFRAVPLYSGKPWFLPLMTQWFRFKDAQRERRERKR